MNGPLVRPVTVPSVDPWGDTLPVQAPGWSYSVIARKAFSLWPRVSSANRGIFPLLSLLNKCYYLMAHKSSERAG